MYLETILVTSSSYTTRHLYKLLLSGKIVIFFIDSHHIQTFLYYAFDSMTVILVSNPLQQGLPYEFLRFFQVKYF